MSFVSLQSKHSFDTCICSVNLNLLALGKDTLLTRVGFRRHTCSKCNRYLRDVRGFYRQRWQAPDVLAELAKRVICACIREICFFRFSMGPKSHKFSTSLLTRHLYTRQLVTELSERADFMTAQQRQGFCR